MSNQYDEISKWTVLVADTGDLDAIRKYKPTDATTNPSLLLSVVQDSKYSSIVDKVIEEGKKHSSSDNINDIVSHILDRMSVEFGTEILSIVPGVVSTEVDARLSFDKEGSIKKGKELIKMYQEKGIDKNRILIKLASTWEGIQAAKELEEEGIHCNMTLLFSMAQAIACSNAKATLISPFVGRILDWYVANTDKKQYSSNEDPGVKSVTEIYKYYKSIGSNTIVMGASFRNRGEITELAGCDKLTISPKLLEELRVSTESLPRKLDPSEFNNNNNKINETVLSEKEFRWQLNEDQMATEKLSEGIRKFAADAIKLENIIKERIEGKK